MMNIFFVGDELVAGHGDPKALGWTGRVAARTLPAQHNLAFHTLAVPGETTADLAVRWDAEVLRRIRADQPEQVQNAIVFAVGRHDFYQRVPATMTRLHLANVLDRAEALGFRALLVGPPPGQSAHESALAELAAICDESAARRNIPYVDLFGPLARHEQWQADMHSGTNDLPLQAGYGLMAWLVLHSAWFRWLGVSPPA